MIITVCSLAYSQTITTNDWKLEIRDSSNYNQSFLKYWRFVKPNPLTIKNDSIIINNDVFNPIIIPTDLPLNEQLLYDYHTNDTIYELKAKRINFTDIEFSINGKYLEKIFFTRNGLSVLSPTFYLGSAGIYKQNEEEILSMNAYEVKQSHNKKSKLLIATGTDEVIDYAENENNIKIYFSFTKKEVRKKARMDK